MQVKIKFFQINTKLSNQTKSYQTNRNSNRPLKLCVCYKNALQTRLLFSSGSVLMGLKIEAYVLAYLVYSHTHAHKQIKTRNSAIADKSRDAFVQMQWRDWLLKKTCSSPCYHAEFGRSALKGVGKPQNWGALGPRPPAVGARLNPRNMSLPRTCYRA